MQLLRAPILLLCVLAPLACNGEPSGRASVAQPATANGGAAGVNRPARARQELVLQQNAAKKAPRPAEEPTVAEKTAPERVATQVASQEPEDARAEKLVVRPAAAERTQRLAQERMELIRQKQARRQREGLNRAAQKRRERVKEEATPDDGAGW